MARAYRDSDVRVVHAAVEESSDHLRPWLLCYISHQSVDDTLAYVRRTQAEYVLREAFEMGIFTLSERYLGGCALHAGDWEIPAFTIGYWIRKGQQGKGYVTEAVRLLTRFAFEDLAAERVVIYCDARNLRSARVAERLGFVFEGQARRARRDTSGHLSDVVSYSLLRDEYHLLFH